MAEYIEREAVLNESIEVYHWNGCEDRYSDFIPTEAVQSIPAADVVKVVRCKDCEFSESYESGFMACMHDNGMVDPKPNDFCSYGKPKDTE